MKGFMVLLAALFSMTVFADKVLFDITLPGESKETRLKISAIPKADYYRLVGQFYVDENPGATASGICMFPLADSGALICVVNGRDLTADIASYIKTNRDEAVMTVVNVVIADPS